VLLHFGDVTLMVDDHTTYMNVCGEVI